MLNFPKKDKYSVQDLCQLISLLRSEDGCSWDKVQTHQTIRRNFLEEVYEAVEAIDLQNSDLLCEELGDVLMQIAFHVEMEREEGRFDLDDVSDGVCRKLIYRHPHLFSENGEAADWEIIKRREKNVSSVGQDLERVAHSLPGTWRLEKIIKKARAGNLLSLEKDTVGFLAEKMGAELCEMEDSREKACRKLLSIAVAAAVANGFDPETLLHQEADRMVSVFTDAENEKKSLSAEDIL